MAAVVMRERERANEEERNWGFVIECKGHIKNCFNLDP
jgi:hypothetical protein